MINKSEKGKLRIGGFGAEPITKMGTFFEVVFSYIEEEKKSCEIEVERFLINDNVKGCGKIHISLEGGRYVTPGKFTLYQNYPNPFNASTNISCYLPEVADMELSVFDLSGRHIKTLIKGKQTAGLKIVKWKGKNKDSLKVSSGLYMYRLRTEKSIFVKKMLLIQ